MIETIPIPRERVEARDDFRVRVSNLYAWPDQELTAAFEYNELRNRYTWECTHTRLGRLWPRGTATLGKAYLRQPYFGARFIDTADKHSHVTPRNLGDDVVLGVFPGPLGGSFHPDEEMTQEEEDEMLNRREWGRALGARP